MIIKIFFYFIIIHFFFNDATFLMKHSVSLIIKISLLKLFLYICELYYIMKFKYILENIIQIRMQYYKLLSILENKKYFIKSSYHFNDILLFIKL